LPKLLEMSPGKGFMLGAGAGPFHVVGRNSELMPNLSYEGDEVRLSSLSQSFISSLSKTRVLRSSSPELLRSLSSLRIIPFPMSSTVLES
jgi:hypothetical protein